MYSDHLVQEKEHNWRGSIKNLQDLQCEDYCSRTPHMIMDAAGSSWRGITAKPEQGVLENRLIKDKVVK